MLSQPNTVAPYVCLSIIDLIRGTIFGYVIHFRMAKAHKRPYATMCEAVSEEVWKEVALGSFLNLRGPKLDEIVGKSYWMTEMVGDSL